MIAAGVVWSTTPLDEFLDGDTSERAEMWRHIGLGVELLGTLAGAGLLIFLALCLNGSGLQMRRLISAATACGAALAAGAAIELIGIAEQFGVDWWEVFDVQGASAPTLRLVGGVLLLFGLEQPAVTGIERWRPDVGSAFGIVGAAAGLVSFGFDGHTVSEGPRVVHLVFDVVHVLAAATWLGGVLALVVLIRGGRRSEETPDPETVIRFSRLATWALAAVALAGVAMISLIAGDLDDVPGTAWGRRLFVKTVAVGSAAVIAAYNHFALVPRLRYEALTAQTIRRVGTTAAVELVMLAAAVLVTLSLVTASPRG